MKKILIAFVAGLICAAVVCWLTCVPKFKVQEMLASNKIRLAPIEGTEFSNNEITMVHPVMPNDPGYAEAFDPLEEGWLKPKLAYVPMHTLPEYSKFVYRRVEWGGCQAILQKID